MAKFGGIGCVLLLAVLFQSSYSFLSRFLRFARTPISTTEIRPKDIDLVVWPSFQNKSLHYVCQEFRESSASNLKPVLLARFVAWALRKVVRKHTSYSNGLDIRVNALSNQNVLRGRVEAIDLTFDKISFNGLFVSGGGRLVLKGVDLRMRRFLFQNLQAVRKPYVLYADLLFTQQDIINSKVIRNLIQMLVNTILGRVFSTNKVISASIRKVSINARRLIAQGTAKLLSDKPNDSALASVDFEVSTSAAIHDEGQTLFLQDVQVTLNPDSILRTVVPIVLTTPIDIDLGDNCRIESLVITNRNIWIRGVSVISPVAPFSVADLRSKALYRYDLSAFLSSLLWLNGGVAVRWRPG